MIQSLQIYAKPELVILSEKKKLREYREEEQTAAVGKMVYNLLLLLGVKDGNTEQHNALGNHIIRAYQHTTIEQIEKAFELFISGTFKIKPFQQLNAVVFGNVMTEYLEYEKQKTKNYRLKIQEFKSKATQMTEQEKDQLMEESIQEAIQHYKQTGEIEMAANKYDWLDLKGKLQEGLTTEEWNDRKRSKYLSVKHRLIAAYEGAKASSKEQKVEFKNILQELQEAKSGKAIVQSKTELLEDYFNSLKS